MIRARFNVKRMNKQLSNALALASSGAVENAYYSALSPIAHDIESDLLASGRGGEQRYDFARQDVRVFRAASGRYNVLFGWLDPKPEAHEKGSGGKLWYQYQDAGFHLFGGARWIEGVGATIDRRERVIDAIQAVNRMYVGQLANVMEGR